MKNPIGLSLSVIAFLAGFGIKSLMTRQDIETMTSTENMNRHPAEELIRQTESSYDKAWKHGDIEAIMACFTNDAVLISPRGDVAIGAEQIRNLLGNFIGSEAKGSTHTSRINRISFVTDDVAVVDGEAFIEGSEGMSESVRHHIFTDILVRSENKWLISQIRAHATN